MEIQAVRVMPAGHPPTLGDGILSGSGCRRAEPCLEHPQAGSFSIEVVGPHLAAQGGILVQTALRFPDVLTDPGPELGACSRSPLAEQNAVHPSDHALYLDLAQVAPHAGSGRNRGHHQSEQLGQLKLIFRGLEPTVATPSSA